MQGAAATVLAVVWAVLQLLPAGILPPVEIPLVEILVVVPVEILPAVPVEILLVVPVEILLAVPVEILLAVLVEILPAVPVEILLLLAAFHLPALHTQEHSHSLEVHEDRKVSCSIANDKVEAVLQVS
jgi:hypothetical protein